MTKPKPKSRTISAPFDARHVGGVSIPGATVPIAGIARTSTNIEPDTVPSHTFAAQGNVEVPRRSNTIATSMNRPSLKLKTSISILRGRSSSNSPDRQGSKREIFESPERTSQRDMSVNSLRKKPSTSRFWQKVHATPLGAESPKEDEILRTRAAVTLIADSPSLRKKPSLSQLRPLQDANPYTYQSPLPPPPLPPPPQPPLTETPPAPPPKTYDKRQHSVRPKRADSGVAVDLNHVSNTERPMGFREILAVPSFAERMALYKKMREYWAYNDHGLNDWTSKAGGRTMAPI